MLWINFLPCLMVVIQVDLMVSGNEPVKAMTYISELQLFSAVFTLPPEFEPSIPDGCDRFIGFVLCVSLYCIFFHFHQILIILGVFLLVVFLC